MFQDLWNRFPYFEGWGEGAKFVGVKAGHTDRQTKADTDRHQTYSTGVASGATRNPSREHFAGVIIVW